MVWSTRFNAQERVLWKFHPNLKSTMLLDPGHGWLKVVTPVWPLCRPSGQVMGEAEWMILAWQSSTGPCRDWWLSTAAKHDLKPTLHYTNSFLPCLNQTLTICVPTVKVQVQMWEKNNHLSYYCWHKLSNFLITVLTTDLCYYAGPVGNAWLKIARRHILFATQAQISQSYLFPYSH